MKTRLGQHRPLIARAKEIGHDRVRFVIQSTSDPLRNDGLNVIRNLCRMPKKISSVYVYDEVGTRLFEEQCRTPEYYLRRAEAGLLEAHAGEILQRCEYPPLVELGAGTAQKTRILLKQYAARDRHCDYFPIDVDVTSLSTAAQQLVHEYPQLHVHCLGGTYEEGLIALPRAAQGRLFLFLGSSLGNMEREEMDGLLETIARHSTRHDHLLLGADLDKDPALINAAYNDTAGYGAGSTLNMLSHLNRRYGANFLPQGYAYRSAYNAPLRCNEVRIESLADQSVFFRRLGFQISFARSERIDAEVMWKFDPQELVQILSRAGFSLERRWIDPVHAYGVFLFRLV